ncbi:MAG: hypothetical protein M1839_002139 [Geoglossum umbratile]|nr:MAG: hypothetical protein M1839_002139 [Geoglossum umbratile]
MSLCLDEPESIIDEGLDMALKLHKDKDNKQIERIVIVTTTNGNTGKARAYPACKSRVICINASDSYRGSI